MKFEAYIRETMFFFCNCNFEDLFDKKTLMDKVDLLQLNLEVLKLLVTEGNKIGPHHPL